jgi:hypothetical protein
MDANAATESYKAPRRIASKIRSKKQIILHRAAPAESALTCKNSPMSSMTFGWDASRERDAVSLHPALKRANS